MGEDQGPQRQRGLHTGRGRSAIPASLGLRRAIGEPAPHARLAGGDVVGLPRAGVPRCPLLAPSGVSDVRFGEASPVLFPRNWINFRLLGAYVPFAAPAPIERVTVSTVTSTGFHVAWAVDLTLHPTFRLTLIPARSPAVQLETRNASLTLSGLEPGVLHLVEIVAQACGKASARARLKVRTGNRFQKRLLLLVLKRRERA